MTGYRADLEGAKARKRVQKLIALTGAGLAGLGGLGALVFWLWHSMFSDLPEIPDAQTLWAMGREPAIEFVDEDGALIAIRGPRYGREVKSAELPAHVVNAFLAVEDRRFFDHDGVDEAAILRAITANLQAGRTVQGGSTLTQQLVKNLFLTPDRTLKRKAQEMRLAMALERKLEKSQILDLYLNRVFLGANAFGIDGAARRYFGVPAPELSLSQAALLAGLPKAPGRSSPKFDLDKALERRDLVLNSMVAAEYITEAEAAAGRAETIELVSTEDNPDIGYALDYATQRLTELGLTAPDLVVTLTLDAELQSAADTLVRTTVEAEGKAGKFTQAATVILRLDGKIAAMVGGIDYETSKFNRTTQALRQPGSAFKTFVYAAAFERGLTPWSVRLDQPISINGWRPENYNGDHLGPMTLADAFAQSTNTIAAALGEEVGQKRVTGLARRLGISTELPTTPAIALGAGEVTVLDMTRAYSAFPNQGVRVDPYIVAKVTDSRGKVLFERTDYIPAQAIRPEIAANMTALLRRVVVSGTGKRAAVEGIETAGKTGTSQSWRDGWFVGFSPDFAIGVWIGNDDNTAMRKITGGAVPASLFAKLIKAAHEDIGPRALPGLEDLQPPDPMGERKLSFYRDLTFAFSALSPRQVAVIEDLPDEP